MIRIRRFVTNGILKPQRGLSRIEHQQSHMDLTLGIWWYKCVCLCECVRLHHPHHNLPTVYYAMRSAKAENPIKYISYTHNTPQMILFSVATKPPCVHKIVVKKEHRNFSNHSRCSYIKSPRQKVWLLASTGQNHIDGRPSGFARRRPKPGLHWMEINHQLKLKMQVYSWFALKCILGLFAKTLKPTTNK